MSASDFLGSLDTERSDPRFAGIDSLPVADLALLMNQEDQTVPHAVAACLPQIVPAIEATADRMSRGGRLVYVGAGTPGRIGVLDASECPPTFSTPPELVFAIIAGGPGAIVAAIEGAEDDAEAGRHEIDRAGIGEHDTVIGIASSGRTPFVLGAVSRARARGALTVGLSCNVETPLSAEVEYPIEVRVGPELVSGSTRLKAGTAQKLVLNMFSTISMIRLGKTYGNLMVDLRPTNAKLRARAIRMVATICGESEDEAEQVLRAVDFDVKRACIMLRLGVDEQEASIRLAAASGRLRDALGES